MSFSFRRNNPDQNDLGQGYISPIRHGRRKPAMSQREAPITPHENDILMGRGGKNNQHTGNNQLRAFAREECRNYRTSSKKGKSYISRELVRRVRELDPPGRFLKKNNDTGLWEDVGDDVAREKASQALRDAVALSEEEEEEEEEQPDLPHLQQSFRRTQSAPPIMDKSPTDERQQTWPVQQQQQQQRRRESTPHYPPVTPASATSAAKRRRFYDNANSPWMYQPEHPPAYSSPDFSSSRSNPEFTRPDFQPSRSFPAQQARRDPRHQHTGAPLLGEVDGDMHEFDLFDGELLEPGDEDPSLERRSDTF